MTTRALLLLLLLAFCGVFSNKNGRSVAFQFEFDAATNLCVMPKYFCDKADETKYRLQNVPGEGDCLFLAVLLGQKSTRYTVPEIRATIAELLSTPHLPLFVTNTTVSSTQLLNHASQELHISPQTYLKQLRTPGNQGGLYGGGPELTVLCNLLERPIRVFHVCNDNHDVPKYPKRATTTASIQSMGEFGTIFFSDQPVSILIVNNGTTEPHACRLWPVD